MRWDGLAVYAGYILTLRTIEEVFWQGWNKNPRFLNKKKFLRF